MKKTYLLVAILAIFALTACDKAESQPTEISIPKKSETESINASKIDDVNTYDKKSGVAVQFNTEKDSTTSFILKKRFASPIGNNNLFTL